MKALVLHAPGDLRVEDAVDEEPGPGEVRVRVAAGGICGSDLHYFRHGGFGTVRLREPMVPGHEIAGLVEALGPGVEAPAAGTLVAVDPGRPCGTCDFCRAGLANQCSDMRFLGSAMRTPHVQGGFREALVCDASRAVPVAPGVTANEAAFAEPLAVCLHAAARAGSSLLGARVLVTGAGPIGALLVAVARHAGAAEVVAADLLDAPLAAACRMGADRVANLAREPGALAADEAGRGGFDVAFEASGSAEAALLALRAVRPRGAVVQVGQGGEVPLPLTPLVAKEVDLRGSFRFDAREFASAVAMIGARRLDPTPLLTEVLPFREARRAFEAAGDRARGAMKIHLAF